MVHSMNISYIPHQAEVSQTWCHEIMKDWSSRVCVYIITVYVYHDKML